MNENWYALALSIAKNVSCEQAFLLLKHGGKTIRKKKKKKPEYVQMTLDI